MRAVEVGHADEVGEHVVAVEAEQRGELPGHLEQLQHEEDEERVPARDAPRRRRSPTREDGVEVEAPEVDPEAAAPRESRYESETSV